MSVLGDDIVNDIMNELSDPVAMWDTLEDTFSSKTGTNILTILNGVVTKKLGRNERMSNHIGHLDNLFHQLTNVQGAGGQGGKDLTITGDISRSVCFSHQSLTWENMMQLLKQSVESQTKMGPPTIEPSRIDCLGLPREALFERVGFY
jgi:hypothetical protein